MKGERARAALGLGRQLTWEHQTWHVTKVASAIPISARHAIHASAVCTNIIPRMAGVVMSRRKASERRGPSMSERKPTITRMTMLVDTAAMLPEPICFLVRSSEAFM